MIDKLLPPGASGPGLTLQHVTGAAAGVTRPLSRLAEQGAAGLRPPEAPPEEPPAT